MSQAVSQHITRNFSRALPKAALAKIEAAVEAHLDAIQALMACLDDHEPDSDLEPSLAHTNDLDQERAAKHLGSLVIGETWVSGGQDLEAQYDGREPSLGVPERTVHCQLDWAEGTSDDRENDGDDVEPEDSV